MPLDISKLKVLLAKFPKRTGPVWTPVVDGSSRPGYGKRRRRKVSYVSCVAPYYKVNKHCRRTGRKGKQKRVRAGYIPVAPPLPPQPVVLIPPRRSFRISKRQPVRYGKGCSRKRMCGGSLFGKMFKSAITGSYLR